jgi:hypothetical protein
VNIIREQYGVAVIEDDGAYFCVGLARPNLQVSSLGDDSPENGNWVANFCRSGLDYVSCARTRRTAMAMFRRYMKRMEVAK